MRAFEKVGIKMPHSTFQQIKFGTGVSKAELQRGDLVFPDPGHVQIYIGNGMVVESPHPGAKVRVTKMWGFYAARRLGTASGSGANPKTQPDIVTTPVSLYDDLKKTVDQIVNIINGTRKAAAWLSSSHNWYRILLIVGGAAMLVIVARETIQKPVMSVVGSI